MKKCKCGCSVFKATIKEEIEVDGTVEFFADGDVNVEEDDHECVISSDYNGPFECVECGAEYETEDEIPDDSDNDTGKNMEEDISDVLKNVKSRINWTVSDIKSLLAENGYNADDMIYILIMESIQKNLSDYI